MQAFNSCKINWFSIYSTVTYAKMTKAGIRKRAGSSRLN